jgi:hypothetical protein
MYQEITSVSERHLPTLMMKAVDPSEICLPQGNYKMNDMRLSLVL